MSFGHSIKVASCVQNIFSTLIIFNTIKTSGAWNGRLYSSLQRLTRKETALRTLRREFSSLPLHSHSMKEIVITCSDGMQLAAKHWSVNEGKTSNEEIDHSSKIVCLHGWLDNAASFNMIAPTLNSRLNADILALDFPGHGHSGHKSPDGPTNLMSEYALYLSETLNFLSWIRDQQDSAEGITLVGHSMGAGIALIYAAAFPEHVNRVVLLDGAGPMARNPKHISRHLRATIERRLSGNKIIYPQRREASGDEGNELNLRRRHGKEGKRVYSDLASAVAARTKTAKLSPGDQYISNEAAAALVGRATMDAETNIKGTYNSSQAGGNELSLSSHKGRVVFRHDPRLQWPSLHYFTQEQVDQLYKDVQCPVCLLQAIDGWPSDAWDEGSIKQLLQPSIYKKLAGSHHFHADPNTAPAVCDEIIEFLK